MCHRCVCDHVVDDISSYCVQSSVQDRNYKDSRIDKHIIILIGSNYLTDSLVYRNKKLLSFAYWKLN